MGYARVAADQPHLNVQMVSLTSSLITPVAWLMAGPIIRCGLALYVPVVIARYTTARMAAREMISSRKSYSFLREISAVVS
jgi:hypothetical protein